jgi:sulfoxide reductase heme-binding subunit YedZ
MTVPRIEQFKALLFVVCLYPLGRLAWFATRGELGANPVEFTIRSLGTWALTFLLITLAVTPLRRLTGWNALIRVRRMLGLFAFFYVCLHFVTYIGIDQFFDFRAIWADIVKRPYITIGVACFLLLAPLAITSTNAMQRRLGGRRWQQLHRLVYVVAIGAVVHYWMLVKKDVRQPLLYGVILGILLLVRLWWRYRSRYGEFSRPPA